MSTWIVVLIVIGIVVLLLNRKGNAPLTVKDAGRSSITGNPFASKKALEGSFDVSSFISPENTFTFPEYKSDQNALVRIKDVTDYKEFLSDFDPDNKRGMTLKQFEFHIISYIRCEVEDFWSFMKRLRAPELAPYPFLKYNIHRLKVLVAEIEQAVPQQPYILQSDKLTQALHENELLVEYTFDDRCLQSDYFEKYLLALNVTALKALSKDLNLKVSLRKAALVRQLLEHMDPKDIPAPLVKHHKFDAMMAYFGEKYLSDIKASIDKWHPYYIEAVWNQVGETIEETETSHLKGLLETYTTTKYWEERLSSNT